MKNGNKVTKKNWHRVVAISTVPNTCVFGVPAIDEARKNGGYFDKWKLVYQTNTEPERTGFIFREINSNHGIDGFHKTFKEAIWSAMRPSIKCFLEDEPSTSIQQPVSSTQQ
ncbi:MAG TPA: hypothetical protein VLH16_01735 [Bacteroidales bacterium]|nr:hypothetical protein [Bacteroidales bacterium]